MMDKVSDSKQINIRSNTIDTNCFSVQQSQMFYTRNFQEAGNCIQSGRKIRRMLAILKIALLATHAKKKTWNLKSNREDVASQHGLFDLEVKYKK